MGSGGLGNMEFLEQHFRSPSTREGVCLSTTIIRYAYSVNKLHLSDVHLWVGVCLYTCYNLTMPSLNQKLFAWFTENTEERRDKILGETKQHLFARANGTVAEIGMGTGSNMQYYPDGVKVIAVEPNEAMERYILENAAELGIEIDIRRSSAEELPLDDESVDTVITTHVLCSVADVQQSLREILRVLKPEGQYLFLEHVAAEQGTTLRVMQNIVRRLHAAAFNGCQCNREIGGVNMKNAGFESVAYRKKNLGGYLSHIKPHIIGAATK